MLALGLSLFFLMSERSAEIFEISGLHVWSSQGLAALEQLLGHPRVLQPPCFKCPWGDTLLPLPHTSATLGHTQYGARGRGAAEGM